MRRRYDGAVGIDDNTRSEARERDLAIRLTRRGLALDRCEYNDSVVDVREKFGQGGLLRTGRSCRAAGDKEEDCHGERSPGRMGLHVGVSARGLRICAQCALGA